jgi:hypothetical protein
MLWHPTTPAKRPLCQIPACNPSFSANCLRALLMKFVRSSTVRMLSTQGSYALR